MQAWTGYALDALADMAGARLQGDAGAGTDGQGGLPLILDLSTDSRSPGLGAQTLFVALSGPSRDGHDFIAEAWQRGVRCFLASRQVPLPGPAFWLLTADTLGGLQALARAHRNRFSYPVLALTGSNGKTIVKEWIHTLVQPDRFVVRSPRSYNSRIGVPLSVWGMRPWHELGLFEAGVSRPGEMEVLETILRPELGLFTCLGAAHDEGFPDREAKLEEKLNLFRHCRSILYCADQEEVAAALRSRYPDRELISWSDQGKTADLQASWSGNRVHLLWRGQEPFSVPLPYDDPFSRENLLHALLAALVLGIQASDLESRCAQLSLPELRLEVQAGQRGAVLVNDAYSSDLLSLPAALAFAARQGGPDRPRTAVLSDIEESGLPPAERYARLSQWLLDSGYAQLLAVGPGIAQARLDPALRVRFFSDTEQLLHAAPGLDLEGHLIFIKGARRFGLERLAATLSEKRHGTRLEINLEALAHNLAVFRDRLPRHTRLLVMVKALGYGSGDAEVARVLEFSRADYLGVAYPDEGVRLRQAGISLPVMVLHSTASDWLSMERYGLEPVLYDLDELEQIRLRYPGLTLHLKLDTGMHRLGLEAEQVEKLCSEPRRLQGLRLRSIFSHLAAAENPLHDDFTRTQLERFTLWSGRIADTWMQAHPGAPQPLRHVLNSAGMLRFPEACLDMVRLGIGLYGYDPTGPWQPYLRPVSRLLATVAQVRDLPAGESIGYGRAHVLDRPCRVATVTIGYADGFRRSLGEGRGELAFAGKRLPVLGKVCMDMIMVDASACPELSRGDTVEVFGADIPLEEYAERMGTIPYEALTGVSSRVKRLYLA
jgi:alanine racemase